MGARVLLSCRRLPLPGPRPRRGGALLAQAPGAPDLLEADALAERLVQLDFLERRYDQAVSRARSLEIDAFSSQWVYVPLSYVVGDAAVEGYSLRGLRSYEAALGRSSDKMKERPDDPRLFSILGLIHAGLGRKDEALRAAHAGVDLMPISREAYRGLFRAEDLARVQALVGNPDAAIDILDDLLTRPSRLCVPVVRLDPAWDPLRSHPRFQALLLKHGARP